MAIVPFTDPIREAVAGVDQGMAGLVQGLMLTREQDLKKDAEARKSAADLTETATTQLARLRALPQTAETEAAIAQLTDFLAQAQNVTGAPKGKAWAPWENIMSAGPAATLGTAGGIATAGERSQDILDTSKERNAARLDTLVAQMNSGIDFTDPANEEKALLFLTQANALVNAPVPEGQEDIRDLVVANANQLLATLRTENAQALRGLGLRNLTATVEQAEAQRDLTEANVDLTRATTEQVLATADEARVRANIARVDLDVLVRTADDRVALQAATARLTEFQAQFAEGQLTDQELGQAYQGILNDIAEQTLAKAIIEVKDMEFASQGDELRFWQETGIIDPTSEVAQFIIRTKFGGQADLFDLQSTYQFTAYLDRQLQEDRLQELAVTAAGLSNDRYEQLLEEGRLTLDFMEYTQGRQRTLDTMSDQTDVNTLVASAMANGDVNFLRSVIADIEDETSDRGLFYRRAGLTADAVGESLARAMTVQSFRDRSLSFASQELDEELKALPVRSAANFQQEVARVLESAARLLPPDQLDAWWNGLEPGMRLKLGGPAVLDNVRAASRVNNLLLTEPLKAEALSQVQLLLSTMPTDEAARNAVVEQVRAILSDPEVAELFNEGVPGAFADGIASSLANAATEWQWAMAKHDLDIAIGQSQVVLNNAQAGYYDRMPTTSNTSGGTDANDLRQFWTSLISGADSTSAGLMTLMEQGECVVMEGQTGGVKYPVPGPNAPTDYCKDLQSQLDYAHLQRVTATQELHGLASAATLAVTGYSSLAGSYEPTPTTSGEDGTGTVPPPAEVPAPAPVAPPAPQGSGTGIGGLASSVASVGPAVAGAGNALGTAVWNWVTGQGSRPAAVNDVITRHGIGNAQVEEFRAIVGSPAGGSFQGTVGDAWRVADPATRISIERSVEQETGLPRSVVTELMQAMYGGR